MKRLWLLFSQAVTVALALYMVWLAAQLHGLEQNRPPVTPASPVEATHADSWRYAARMASPAVVSITTRPADWADLPDTDPDAPAAEDMGSGVIMSKDGYILTNYHVIEDASGIGVQLADGRRADADVIGTDLDTDLAVLKINLPNLPSIHLGDATTLQVGDPVLAIGDPFGVGQTVTSGIVSALGRNQLGLNTYEDFIQTDAAINPGNSGGALVDLEGRLVGINTAIYSRTGGYMGIGFATSVHTAKKVLDDIVQHGRVQRAWIGVEPAVITPQAAASWAISAQTRGVLVASTQSGGPAELAGIQAGDVIIRIQDTPITHPTMLLSVVSGLPLQQDTSFTIHRNGQDMQLSVRPGTRYQTRPRPRADPQQQP